MTVTVSQSNRSHWTIIQIGQLNTKNLATFRTRQEACEAVFDFTDWYRAANNKVETTNDAL